MSILEIKEHKDLILNPLQVSTVEVLEGHRVGKHPRHPHYRPHKFWQGWQPARVVIRCSDGTKHVIPCASNHKARVRAASLRLQLEGLLNEYKERGWT